MDIPAVRVLLVQEQCSLKDHTRDFLDLVCLTHSHTHLFYVFYHTSLNKQSKARLPMNGP